MCLTLTPMSHVAATQAYGDDWSVDHGGPHKQAAIKLCSTTGTYTSVTTTGGAAFTVHRLRVVKGSQDIDNLVSAKMFVRTAAPKHPSAEHATWVVACKVRVVSGVRRMQLRLVSGAHWRLGHPYVESYYMSWA
jgi:hypothetical protein